MSHQPANPSIEQACTITLAGDESVPALPAVALGDPQPTAQKNLARYFSGEPSNLGSVQALPQRTFEELVEQILLKPIPLPISKQELLDLPTEEANDRKRVRYLVPAVFAQSPSKRQTTKATACNLVFIDIDDSSDASRLLGSAPGALLGDLGAVIYHTARSKLNAPRLRVVVHADAIPAARYPEAVEELGKTLGINPNKESLVPVQPMYLPCSFQDSTEDPIVYANPTGRQFTLNPLSGGNSQAKTSPIDYLQPPDPDVTREVAKAHLDRIPASCGRDTWIRVGMGLKHQFGDAGYELWDSWSATCEEKYPGPTKTHTEWDSFNNNPPGKTPVTYGTVRHLAKPVELVLPGAGITITDCARTLFREIALQKQIFVRGGALQELMPRDGSTSLRVITPEAFQSRIETYGRVVKCDSKTGKLVSAICSRPTAASLMQSEEAERLLPAIELLSGCPIFAKTPDGAKVLHEGWHPQKVYVTAGGTPPRVTIQEAIASLENILGDFDFATPSDRTRALAALISPAMSSGGWIDKHPFIIVMADVSQTGKGYLLECIAAIYREIPSIITPRRGGVGGVDESIDQALIDGRPFIQLDNWRGDLASPRLEALITAPGLVNARVPHRSEVSVNPRRFVFQLTSNGLEVTPDLANRASIIRLRKRPRGYIFRNYSEGELVSHLKANQPYYLGCVFAILQEWFEYGTPSNGDTGHSFRDWAGKVGWITDNLFMQHALLGDADAAARNLTDTKEAWLRALLQRIVVQRRHGKLPGPFSATALAEVAVEVDLLPPGVNGDDTNKCRQRIGTILKDMFDRSEQIEVDGRRLTRSVVRGDKGEERKVYQLSD